jgi:hypothetical protein
LQTFLKNQKILKSLHNNFNKNFSSKILLKQTTEFQILKISNQKIINQIKDEGILN